MSFDPAWELTDSESVLLLEAEQVLVVDCMEREGFDYWVWGVPAPEDLKGGGYLLSDVEWAREHGYGSEQSDRMEEIQREDPNHAYANGLAGAEQRRYSVALNGSTTGSMLTAELPGGGGIQASPRGCLAESKDRLYGDFETWFQVEKVALHLGELYVPDLLEDQRFVRAQREWSDCLREAGYDYPDPPAIRDDLARLTNSHPPADAFEIEQDLAVAEATCATTASFSETAHELNDEYRAGLSDEYGEDLGAYQRMARAALARARDIVPAAN